MTVSGDLASIDLADLLQNIQVHGRTGTLTLSGENNQARVFFRGGNIALLSSPERQSLADRLVSAGMLPARKLELARKKQRGTKRTLAEILVNGKALTAEQLWTAAEEFLTEDVVNLIASASGEFHFEEGAEPTADFDADEASLELALQVAPLILEATRRIDHWTEIRKYIPSESMHFQVRDGAHCREDVEDPELAAQLLQQLDGSSSIKEVADRFPFQRFLACKLLAEFVRDRVARPTSADDLRAIAHEAEANDPARARQLVRRGLDSEPHHPGLLAAEARLAEALGEPAAAAAASKLLAHLHLETGHTEEALQQLENGKRLTPADPTIWERTLTLALTQGRRQDALAEGMQLVQLYRAPGLHSRAKDVLERLLKVEPDSVELHIEHARTRVDCGESADAVKSLLRQGKVLIGQEDYDSARALYEEALDIEPGNREASLSIEMIDQEIFKRRRERKRRAVRILIASCTGLLLGMLLVIEIVARVTYVEVRSLIARERMIEEQRYAEVIALLERVRTDHPLTPTALLEIPRHIADLQQQLAAQAPTGR